MKLCLSFVRRLIPRRSMLIAVMVGCAFMILPCTQAPAARWGRELNPQPLPPGTYTPIHPGTIASGLRTSLPVFSTRRVCVAWGRVCVKAGQGSPTHPAPCAQYEYVCRKYG
jgi:hypothetical protein